MSYFDLENIDDSYDSDFPYPHLDPPQQNNIRYVGVDKPRVERPIEDPILAWVTHESNQYELGDQMGDHSDQQEYDKED